MLLTENMLREGIKDAIDKSVIKKEGKSDKVRKFDESVDVIVNLRDVDFNRPENKLDVEHLMPHPVRKEGEWNVCFFVNGDLELAAKEKGFSVYNKDDLDNLQGRSRKEKKEVVKSHDYFVAEAPMMINIAKSLGRLLGRTGKMIKPAPKGYGIIQPNADIEEVIPNFSRIIRLKMNKPVVQFKIGKKSHNQEDLYDNLNSVLTRIQQTLPNRAGNIQSIYIKTTMGPSVTVDRD